MKRENETFAERLARVLKDPIEVVPYNPQWPELFEQEKRHLLACLPEGMSVRIEHFGSTAVPNLAAKPIVDMLIEVRSIHEVYEQAVPILEGKGYDYFRRKLTKEDDTYYAWFIKRDSDGRRTHHIHIVEADSHLWDNLYFRDYLREFPQTAKEYEMLKMSLALEFPDDRERYTDQKGEFIRRITEKAKQHYDTG